jgi:hypothetical protein
MNPLIQPKQRLICPRAGITKRKILRNMFICVGVFFAVVRLLFADTTDGVLNFNKSALGVTPPPIITFDAPGAGTGPNQGTRALAVTPAVTIAGHTGPGDQINTNPMLGPLQDIGGPTFTHALLPGSPAIDAGDPNFTPPPFDDQRGPRFARVVNGRIDIDSFEAQLPRATPTPRPRPTPASSALTLTR